MMKRFDLVHFLFIQIKKEMQLISSLSSNTIQQTKLKKLNFIEPFIDLHDIIFLTRAVF